MIDLLTIRHAPVDAEGLCYGQTNVPTLLTPGEVVARIEPRVRDHEPVRIWSSDARRCVEPAALLSARLEVDHVIEPLLRELSYGAWEGKAWTDLPPKEVARWRTRLVTAGPPGGESFTQLAERVGRWWATLSPGRHLLVGHAGVMHSLDIVAAGMTWDQTVSERFGYLEERRFTGESAGSGQAEV